MKKKLTVFPSLYEDSNAGWIWIPPIDGFTSRDYINLSILKTGRKITCICRIIDTNFQNHYNDGPRKKINDIHIPIVISDYYRNRLGSLKTGQECEFEIKKLWSRNYPKKIFALLQHPDNAIKMAAWLALWSIILGIASILSA